jgi:hypothetical protein
MIRQIAPLFFTMDIPGTLAYYKDKLGSECLGTRGLANMPWGSREFVVKDCDGRLLAFGANL